MQARLSRDAMIARLKAEGVTDAEIAEINAYDAAHEPDHVLPSPPLVRYRVRNWSAYNQALTQRGSRTFWRDGGALAGWLGNERPGRGGAPPTYADTPIRCVLTLTAVFRLPLRLTQGLTTSLLALLGVTLPVPTYRTVSRRAATIQLPRLRAGKTAHRHLGINASGLKIYGAGEGRVQQHGWTKHRTWRKLHLGVDERPGEIVAQVLPSRAVADQTQVGALLRHIPGRVQQLSADGADDYNEV